MADTAMPGQGMGGQLEPQAVRLLMQILNVLRKNGPQAWPQLFQMAVRAGIPQEILPPPNAPPNVIAQFAKKLVMFLRAHGAGAQQPQQQQAPMQHMQQGPAMAMAYGGPVLDVTAATDRPAMAMAFGGRVDSVPVMMRPGEYVATPEALAYDPTLDDRISAANRATAGGMEGPIMLAQQGPTLGTQVPFMEGSPDFYGPAKKPDAPQGPRYKGGSDFKAKPPTNEEWKRFHQNAQEDIKRGRKQKKRGE